MKTKHQELNIDKDNFKIIHITDTHLFSNKDGILKGAVNSFEKLQEIIDHIQQNVTDFDAIIVTGDISEDRSAESYKLFEAELERLGKPSFWLPGNHDTFKNMPNDILEKYVFSTADIGAWKFIFLDTSIPDVDHGNLAKNEFDRLKSFLQENEENNTIVCMHHPPIDVGSEFIDVLGLANKDQFWKVIQQNPRPKAIFFGHVHQVINENKDGILLSSPPSACLQWVPKSREFACNPNGEGYQTIMLMQNGTIATKYFQLKLYL